MSSDSTCKTTQRDILELLGDQWSNAACCGYLIIASEMLGLSTEQLQELLNAMENAFEYYSVEHAKTKYMNY